MDDFKIKIIKKCSSWLVLIAVVVGMLDGFSTWAFANLEQEEKFCIDKMNNLPTDSEFLTEATKLPDINELSESREEPVLHMNDTLEDVVLNEKSCYKKIANEVERLKETVKDAKTDLSKETGQYSNLSEKMRLANEIYRWVAKNIRVDHESFDSIKNDTQAYVKPQDEYFVYDQKLGFCEGYARLLNLMMRMAEIPCIYIASINGPTENYGHAFNAVYIEDSSIDRKGWTLLDSANAWPGGFDRYKYLTKFLFGEAFFDLELFNSIVLRNDDYAKNIYDLLEISFEQCQDPSQEFINEKNKKAANILKILNKDEKYRDGPHFKEIKFFNQSGYLYFNYKTDVTMTQVKQIEPEENGCFFEDELSYAECQLMEYDKNFVCCWNDQDLTNNVFLDNLKNFMCDSDILRYLVFLNGPEKEANVNKYFDKLKEIFIDVISKNSKDIKGSIDNINKNINLKLEKLNKNYPTIEVFENIKLNFDEPWNDGRKFLYAHCEAKSHIDDERKIDQKNHYLQEKFDEFFPAFYNYKQSFKDANMSVIKHRFHKISTFEIDIKNVNIPALLGESHEGNARLNLNCQVDVDISSLEALSPQEQKQQLEEIERALKTLNIFDNHVECGDLFIIDNKYGITVNIPSCIEKLKLCGSVPINIDSADELSEIDTTNSKIYDFENGILYEKVNGKRGREVARTNKTRLKVKNI